MVVCVQVVWWWVGRAVELRSDMSDTSGGFSVSYALGRDARKRKRRKRRRRRKRKRKRKRESERERERRTRGRRVWKYMCDLARGMCVSCYRRERNGFESCLVLTNP